MSERALSTLEKGPRSRSGTGPALGLGMNSNHPIHGWTNAEVHIYVRMAWRAPACLWAAFDHLVEDEEAQDELTYRRLCELQDFTLNA